MNLEKIREQTPPMVLWMADATIREACKALNGGLGRDDVKCDPYNLPEMNMAGEILFQIFVVCAYDVKMALIAVQKSGMNGFYTYPDRKYFDEFVKELSARLSQQNKPLELRQADWMSEYR